MGGVVSVRYKFLEAPISLRVQGLIGAGTAVVPTVSYDFPLNWQTDAYVGAGLSFASGDSPSPVGDQTSFAIQPGVDFMIPNSNTVLFGNAIVAFDAYRQGSGTAFSLQGGVGLQF
jgi:opacity protein-like surface antigen